MQVPLGMSTLKQSILAQTENRDKCLEIETRGVMRFFEVKCFWSARNVTSYVLRPPLYTGKDSKKK